MIGTTAPAGPAVLLESDRYRTGGIEPVVPLVGFEAVPITMRKELRRKRLSATFRTKQDYDFVNEKPRRRFDRDFG